ncbi:T9SS type A sorting domain-containing protein [Pontibacter sp. G13]|uniref:T9SS type A sorting domain-containing protein n=1 Tax=Pontibacter sp. G13 TaxID=3074898 RepID=UPI0028897AC3|nr:T9SS type A sorting domain-containing protein [Pontibacter sp. G13]WNJ20126.1 T9SS type A sorting domain-containing protein [Pontibacter sp. G13]
MATTTKRATFSVCLGLCCMLMAWPNSSKAQSLYQINWADASDPLFSGSGGAALTQVVDTTCGYLQTSVTDPVNAPLPAFSPLILNPQIAGGGGDLVDLSGNMSFHVRVQSRDTIQLGCLLRSGDGSSGVRTSRISQMVPGDTATWTELTFTYDSSTIGGFDSTDLRDIWLYLDPGDDNFAGDDFRIDFFSIGSKPDSSDYSTCPEPVAEPYEFPWVLHWADTLDQLTSGSGAEFLDQVVDTACSQLLITVPDPILNPHVANKTLRLDPLDEFGNDLADLSGQLRMYVRVRSAEAVELSIRLRSGAGEPEERTEYVIHTIPGGLDQWTDLVYDFSGANLSGFDSTDLRDIFMYLDRQSDNWPGNEVYFDYVSLGSAPESVLESTCVEADPTSISALDLAAFSISPNPIQSGERLQIQGKAWAATDLDIRVMDLTGKEILKQTHRASGQMETIDLNLPALNAGIYLVRIGTPNHQSLQKLIIQ